MLDSAIRSGGRPAVPLAVLAVGLLATASGVPGQEPGSAATTLFHLALEARHRGEPAAAADWLERAVRLDPQAVEPRLEWASVLLQLGRAQDVGLALDPLEAGLTGMARTMPSRAAQYYRLRAAASARTGDGRSAVDFYGAALRLDPLDLALRVRLVQLHRARGESQAALAHLQTAVELDPLNIPLRIELGRSLLDLARWSEAEAAFRAALGVTGADEEAWEGLGLALTGQDRHAAAERAYREGLRVAPSSARLYERLGDALVEEHRFAEAVRAYERAATLAPPAAEELRTKIDRARSANLP